MLGLQLAAMGEGASSPVGGKTGFSEGTPGASPAKKTTRKSEKDQFSLGNTIFLQ